MAKKRIYIVVRGRKPGIYSAWSGEQGAAKQVQGFPGALFRGFDRGEDALAWLEGLGEAPSATPAPAAMGPCSVSGATARSSPGATA